MLFSCHIWSEPFSPTDLKLKDHCHFLGKYRGPVHNYCNLNYVDDYIIPVIFHNLSGYNSHFIIEALAKEIPGDVQLLPVNKRKCISFTKQIDNANTKFRFLDPFRFVTSGLDKLSSYLDDSEKTTNNSFRKIITNSDYCGKKDFFHMIT